MKQPPQIIFRGRENSPAVEEAARTKAVHLDRFASDIMSCRVVVDLLQKHKHQGRPLGVRLDLTLPGHELVMDRIQNVAVYLALREAFDIVECQLEDVVRLRCRDQNQHPHKLHGEVVGLNGPEGFGFIRTPDGDAYHFGSDNLTAGRLDQLEVGTAAPFITDSSAQGSQAKRVSLGKHAMEH